MLASVLHRISFLMRFSLWGSSHLLPIFCDQVNELLCRNAEHIVLPLQKRDETCGRGFFEQNAVQFGTFVGVEEVLRDKADSEIVFQHRDCAWLYGHLACVADRLDGRDYTFRAFLSMTFYPDGVAFTFSSAEQGDFAVKTVYDEDGRS